MDRVDDAHLTGQAASAVSVVAGTGPPPDPRCPFCVALAALPWPAAGTAAMRLCAPHLTLWRQLQCRGWNAEPQHQVQAGQARARQFTSTSQQQAGLASSAAFSARWRASGGLAPLSADAVRKYVTPAMIRGVCGLALAPELQADIYRAWCAGQLVHVRAWLAGEAPPNPAGLWATRTAGMGGDVDGAGWESGPDSQEGRYIQEGDTDGAR